jgi:hypothetical protein
MDGVQRAGGQRVDHVGHQPGVLEVEVGGVAEVDVRLRDAVHAQQPAVRPVEVVQQFDLAEGHLISAWRWRSIRFSSDHHGLLSVLIYPSMYQARRIGPPILEKTVCVDGCCSS